MKRLTGLMLSGLLIAGLTACGSDDGGNQAGDTSKKTTITMGFWGAAQDLKIYQDAAASISEQYPNIELKIKQYPSSEQFWNILPGEIAAGVAPDFIKISNEGAYEYINKGLFASVDELIPSAGVDMSRFASSAMDIWKKDGKQYGVPNINMPAMFFINEDMWKQAGLGDYPKTWDEVEAAAKKLKTDDVYGITINLDAYHITNYVKSYGGGWGNGSTINSPENTQALQKIFDMYKEGVAITPKSLGYGWDGEVFASGKAAMTTGGYWYKGYLKDANPNLKYVALPIPKGTVDGSVLISDAYVVLKDSANKEAALQAAYYMTNDQTQTEFLKLGFNSAVSSLSSEYFEENPEFKSVEPALAYSTDFGYPTETKKFIDELVKQLEASILGGSNKSPKDVLDSVQQQFQ
ncbi:MULTISPECIES: sugar ABC transporter substrate-binding protein [unclassified Paenibacillus]|uniref:ABC transporter substrate-binding protein n=1 Tax=unclassified Paenibacillus TaxID=185978 RepID=UPI001AEB43F2|nr:MULTISPECIES: sugar ABC transporter substrate-binding protein [unclassified Paenibacillus]MBP1154122.1 multiple sugar transport system substrate-binding protein [Paenibacillus sp. PvP091]MBP1170493.1 multiple sugar transport system substrate-binding protein [Paenibacillus sp. PvR098]MBP2441521.1 multiple sugar transport system substrate-binding protein [Paenibacillus sp. PvP052]